MALEKLKTLGPILLLFGIGIIVIVREFNSKDWVTGILAIIATCVILWIGIKKYYRIKELQRPT